MITIRYYKDEKKITVDGHALYGESGKDIVCAAVSILTYTLSENLKGITTANAKFDNGHATICCVNDVSGFVTAKSEIDNVFTVICKGYALLAKSFPEHVSFETI